MGDAQTESPAATATDIADENSLAVPQPCVNRRFYKIAIAAAAFGGVLCGAAAVSVAHGGRHGDHAVRRGEHHERRGEDRSDSSGRDGYEDHHGHGENTIGHGERGVDSDRGEHERMSDQSSSDHQDMSDEDTHGWSVRDFGRDDAATPKAAARKGRGSTAPSGHDDILEADGTD